MPRISEFFGIVSALAVQAAQPEAYDELRDLFTELKIIGAQAQAKSA